MTRVALQLTLTVVTHSGAGHLEGRSGAMAIDISNGRHTQEFEYTLAAAGKPNLEVEFEGAAQYTDATRASSVWRNVFRKDIDKIRSNQNEQLDSSPAVVLDTNIFVAAGFKHASASACIVEAVRCAELRLAWNDATRQESERIIRKIRLLRGMDLSPLFRAGDRVVIETHPERFTVIVDPDDRKFAALACAAHATLITNDAHLLTCQDHLSVTVSTPGAFWEILKRLRSTDK